MGMTVDESVIRLPVVLNERGEDWDSLTTVIHIVINRSHSHQPQQWRASHWPSGAIYFIVYLLHTDSFSIGHTWVRFGDYLIYHRFGSRRVLECIILWFVCNDFACKSECLWGPEKVRSYAKISPCSHNDVRLLFGINSFCGLRLWYATIRDKPYSMEFIVFVLSILYNDWKNAGWTL